MPQQETTIYALAEPGTMVIRYIGKADDVNRRVRRHMKDGHDGKMDHKSRWIRSLIDKSMAPSVIVLEKCPASAWKDREKFWISRYREAGFDLTNSKDGGDGIDPTPEVRARMSAAKKGRPSHNKGKPWSEESRRKMSESAKERWAKHNPEERRILLAKNIANLMRINKSRAGQSWGKHTEETKSIIAVHSRINNAKRKLAKNVPNIDR